MSAAVEPLPGTEWRPDAVRAIVDLSRRRGTVGLEDVEAVLPAGAPDSEVREFVRELVRCGVRLAASDEAGYGPAGASPLDLYFRDIGQGPLLTPAGERILADRLRKGVLRRLRALSRTVVGATAAVAACRAVVAGTRQALDVVTDAVGKRGRPALAAAVHRAQLAIDRCVLAEAAAAGRGGSRARGADRLVCGRQRIRMSKAVQALGLCPSGVEEMASAVNAAFSLVRLREAPVLRRPGSSHAPRSRAARSRTSPRGVRPARDGSGFLDHAIRRARQGSAAAEQARQKFIEMNLRLVVAFAKRMYRPDLGVSFPDLVQEGNLGLMKAVERFDPAQGRFSTYAAWWIRQAMKRAVTETGCPVRIPVHVQDGLAHVALVESELSRATGSRPAGLDVAAYMGVEPAVVERLRLTPRRPVSLDAPVRPDDEDGDTWGARLPDADAVDPEQDVGAREFRRLLSTVMSLELADVEQAALCRRFGLADLEDPAGGQRLAAYSRERVRRLEVRALRKLQASAHAEHLRVFLPSSSAP